MDSGALVDWITSIIRSWRRWIVVGLAIELVLWGSLDLTILAPGGFELALKGATGSDLWAIILFAVFLIKRLGPRPSAPKRS